MIVAAAALAVAAAGGGTAVAMAATAPAPAVQPPATYVYACVNPAGGIGYLEFRGILPHACNPGLSLWRWPAVIPPPVAPTATPTR
jgi:hypothetical protein